MKWLCEPCSYYVDPYCGDCTQQRSVMLHSEYQRGLRDALAAMPSDEHGMDLVAVTEHAQDAYRFRAKIDREAIERLLEQEDEG